MRDNIILGVLLALAVWMLAIGARTYWYPAGVTLLIALNLFLGFRLPGSPRLLFTGLLAVPFGVWAKYLPRDGFTGFFPVDALLMLGFYTVALGMHHLLTARSVYGQAASYSPPLKGGVRGGILFSSAQEKSEEPSPNPSLGGRGIGPPATGGNRTHALAAAIIAFALAGVVDGRKQAFYAPALPLFITLVLLELRRELGLLALRLRRRDLLRYGLALTALLALTVLVQTYAVGNIPALNRWITRKIIEGSPPSAGFDRVTHLGSIPRVWNQGKDGEIVLRYFTKDPDEYLRGAAYDRYTRATWQVVEERQDIAPLAGENGRSFFDLARPAGARDLRVGEEVEVPPSAGTLYPDRQFADTFFLPGGVRRLSAFDSRLLASAALTVRSPSRSTAGGYRYFEPVGDPESSAPPSDADLDVQDHLRAPLRGVLETALAEAAETGKGSGVVSPEARLAHRGASRGATTRDPFLSADPEAVADAIRAYFVRHFDYRIGLELTTGKDPLIEFLEDIQAGHCEYFASAGTLLLRQAGVPARYATGFVCREPGGGGDHFVSRRRDAHAWVEMYVAGKGWVTFDPTPPAAQPPAHAMSDRQRFADLLQSYWERFISVLSYGGITGVLGLLWGGVVWLMRAAPIPLWAVFFVLAIAWIFRENLREAWKRERRRGPATPRVKALRKKLRRAEKIAARHGLRREPSATAGTLLRAVRAATIPDEAKREAVGLLEEYQSQRFAGEAP